MHNDDQSDRNLFKNDWLATGRVKMASIEKRITSTMAPFKK